MQYRKLMSSRHVDKETGVYYHFVDSDSEHFAPHFHEYYEIMVFLDDAYHLLNGNKRLEKKGTVMLICPEDRHFLFRDRKFYLHNIAFSVECAKSIFSYFDTECGNTSVVLGARELRCLHNAIIRVHTLGIDSKREQARQFKAIIMDIFIKYFLEIPNDSDEIPDWLQELSKTMRYPENFVGGIDKMVALSGKSREHICRSYKKHLGQTPSEFINDIKLNYAANLLLNSNMSVLDISLESGFENLAWFYELFKKKFHQTPKTFRNKTYDRGTGTMQILKLNPTYKDYIWGGEKLRTRFGKNADVNPVAESWELSCHPDGLCTIDGGKYDGQTLKQYIEEHPSCLGTLCASKELPILIKLIDAADNLSVQVHPDDKTAMELEGQNGKTEMWYVIDADDGAKITYGVKKDTTPQELKKAIAENTIDDMLSTVDSKKGDVFFVKAGTIHAIGKGNLIAEIQQNSNVTYRFYDYNRVGRDGKPRELHVEKALMVADCSKPKAFEPLMCNGGERLIGKCEYFCTYELKVDGKKTLCADEKSYNAIVVTDGKFTVSYNDKDIVAKAGQTLFVPAGLGDYVVSGEGTILLVTN